jgi:hypothetical protein
MYINKSKLEQLITFFGKTNNEFKLFRIANNIFIKKQAGFLVNIAK